MISPAAGVMTGDAIRGFVVALRKHSGLSQDKLAERIGMPSRTYLAWETGETKDIKVPYLLKALQVLEAPFAYLEHLIDKRYEDGARLADRWISREAVVAALTPEDATPEEQRRLNRLIELLAEGVPPEEAARRVLHGR
jgi:transcriptional regulator with XRE-family HTH domain